MPRLCNSHGIFPRNDASVDYPCSQTIAQSDIHDSLDPVLIQQIQRRGLFLCLNESSQDTLGHRYTRTRNKSIHTVINDLESGAHDLFGLQLAITT